MIIMISVFHTTTGLGAIFDNDRQVVSYKTLWNPRLLYIELSDLLSLCDLASHIHCMPDGPPLAVQCIIIGGKLK